MVLLLIGSAAFLIPLLWMFATAVKPIDQTMSLPPRWMPISTTTTIDGQSVEVGVGKVEEDAKADSEIRISTAYQWVIDREGQTIPVRLIDTLEDGRQVVGVHYHLEIDIDGRTYPIRRFAPDELDTTTGQVNARVIYPDRSIRRQTVKAEDIRRLVDVTELAVGRSYSFVENETAQADQLTRQYIPWNSRQDYAHTQTENLTALLGDLDESIQPQWSNFPGAVREMGRFWRYLFNTLALCFLTVVGTAASSAVVAYGFSRIDWPGRDKVFIFVLATMMIPAPVVMVPLYGLFRELGWIGTLRPLWVPAFFAGAFNVFLLRQFFKTIPKELSEAARIDGCSELRIFLQVIVPLAKPSITVVALFQFLYTWNDFLNPLIYLTDEKNFTIALALQAFQSQQGGTQWHYLMAASTLVVAPIIFLFFLTQRTFIEGVSMSGLKG